MINHNSKIKLKISSNYDINSVKYIAKTYHASTWLTFHELRYKKLKFSLNTVNQSLSMQGLQDDLKNMGSSVMPS